MNRFAIALITCASAFLPAESAERLTRECNTNFGNGEVILTTSPQARQELLAIVADPARNRDVFERLWTPQSVREAAYGSNPVVLGYDRAQDTDEIARTMRADPVLTALGVSHVGADASGACFSAMPPAPRVTITEYHNRLLDHYFLSSSAAENTIIDSGGAGEGWERTGETFAAIAPGYCYDSRPVFRFYGRGPNSHFFTVDTAECGNLRNADPGWRYEGEAFGAKLPASGACPSGMRPLYRLYNNRAAANDSNHRFVARLDLYAQMQARGWIGEGITLCLDSRP